MSANNKFFSEKEMESKNSLFLSLQYPFDQLLLETQKIKNITFFFEKNKGGKREEDEEMKALKRGVGEFSTPPSLTTFVSLSFYLPPHNTSFTAHYTALYRKSSAGLAQWQSTGLVNQGSRDQTSESAYSFFAFFVGGSEEGWRVNGDSVFFRFLLFSLFTRCRSLRYHSRCSSSSSCPSLLPPS